MLGGVNGTPLDITLTLNRIDIGPLPRVAGALPLKESVPALPWSVQAHAPSGRVILTFDVPEDHVDGTFDAVDLSCGRVMVWVGSDPLFGPAPPSGVVGAPGDCGL